MRKMKNFKKKISGGGDISKFYTLKGGAPPPLLAPAKRRIMPYYTNKAESQAVNPLYFRPFRHSIGLNIALTPRLARMSMGYRTAPAFRPQLLPPASFSGAR